MEREQLQNGVKKLAWGYVLLHFDINLGTMDILPNWGGYLLFLSALAVIAQVVPSAALLRPFAVGLALWEGLSWVLKLIGAGADLGVLSLIVSVVSLYFHFQLLTNTAELSEAYGCPQTGRILTLRTVRTVVSTLLALPLPWNEYTALVWAALIIGIVVAIWICSVMFSLRRALGDDGGETENISLQ